MVKAKTTQGSVTIAKGMATLPEGVRKARVITRAKDSDPKAREKGTAHTRPKIRAKAKVRETDVSIVEELITPEIAKSQRDMAREERVRDMAKEGVPEHWENGRRSLNGGCQQMDMSQDCQP